MDAAVGPAVLDALDSGGDTPKDAHLVTSVVKLTALEVGHLEAEFPHQVVVNEVGVWSRKNVGDQGGEGPALAGEHVLFIVVAISVTGGKYRLGFGLLVEHRWLVQF